MTLDDDQKDFLQLLRKIISLPLHWFMNYSPDDNEFLVRLNQLEEVEGKIADKGLYQRVRNIVKSGGIKDKREFVISTISDEFPNADELRRMFKDLPEKLVLVAFGYFSLVKLARTRDRRISVEWERRQIVDQYIPRSQEWIKAKARQPGEFSKSIINIGKMLEREPDNMKEWAILRYYLDEVAGIGYLAKAAQAVYDENVDCHIRTKRELAQILIDHGAPTAAEKLLNGATLDPFA